MKTFSFFFLFSNFFWPPTWDTYICFYCTLHYVRTIYGRAAAVVDSLFLQLLPSFSVPAYLLHLLTVTRPLSVVYTIICGCCQASPSLLTIAAFADEAAAQDVAAAYLAFCCWA